MNMETTRMGSLQPQRIHVHFYMFRTEGASDPAGQTNGTNRETRPYVVASFMVFIISPPPASCLPLVGLNP